MSVFPSLFLLILNIILVIALAGGFIYLMVLLVRCLRLYLKNGDARKEKQAVKQSLGATLKSHREACHMTQEYVAEQLGVSRQAVSKWENGASEPSTSNLLALAKLYQADAGDLLKALE